MHEQSEQFESRVHSRECRKVLLRRILEQTHRNSDVLAAIKSCLNRHDQRFDDLERSFGNLEHSLSVLEGEFGSFRNDLTTVIRDVMREVLDEHDKSHRAPR